MGCVEFREEEIPKGSPLALVLSHWMHLIGPETSLKRDGDLTDTGTEASDDEPDSTLEEEKAPLVKPKTKDAFFCIPMHKDSQEFFAFEWENPETGRRTQFTWAVLPQGYKNSPTIFGNQLAKELEDWRRQEPEGVVLQYVDDILIAVKSQDN
ncbi:hypothetical protein BTVI_48117 [Pitangus sulphuratus]|nr:hypothetical protein BTVI_48117 [Pitangus sulphuratus]